MFSIPFMKTILMIFITEEQYLDFKKTLLSKKIHTCIYIHIQQNPNIQMYKLAPDFWTKFISLRILSDNKNNTKKTGQIQPVSTIRE